MRYGAWLYPWDLVDFGPEAVMRELHAMGMTEVFLALSYHSVRVLLPDNPRRRHYDAEQAAVYFPPDGELWDRLGFAPIVSDLVATQGDAAALARRAIGELPLRLAAWTVCLHDATLPRRHPAVATLDVWGQRSTRAMCLANPSTRAYARTLVADVAQRVDAVQLEAAHWLTPHAVHAKLDAGQPQLYRRLCGFCVCTWCGAALAARGVDADRVRAHLARVATVAVAEPERGVVVPDAEVDAYLADKVPDYVEFLRTRTDAVTTLVAALADAASALPVEFVSYGDRRASGADLAAIERLGVGIRVLAYGAAPVVTAGLETLCVAADAPTRFGVGLSALPADAADEADLRAACVAARRHGADSVAFYNYGMLTAARRGWLGRVTALLRPDSALPAAAALRCRPADPT